MYRSLATAIFAYAGLSAAQWGHAVRRLHAPPGAFMCGNVISDPLALLVNVAGPLAAASAAILARRCVKARLWPCYAITALFTFVVTSACLAYEVHILSDYGLQIGRVWWLPWR